MTLQCEMSSDDGSFGQRSGRSGRKYASDSSNASDLDRDSDASEDGPVRLPNENDHPDDDADLFGSGTEDGDECVAPYSFLKEVRLHYRSRRRRRLDDEELDSGDDEARYDRAGSMIEEDGEEYGETRNIMDVKLGRAPEPEPTDGEV